MANDPKSPRSEIEPEVEPSEDMLSDVPDDDDDMDDIEGIDMGPDLGAILTTEDGDTVCTALLDINNAIGELARQLSTQNKILVKILSKMA